MYRLLILCLLTASCSSGNTRPDAAALLDENQRAIQAETAQRDLMLRQDPERARTHQLRIDSLLRVGDSLLQVLSR